MEDTKMLEMLGIDMAAVLDDVEFIGVQQGFGTHPSVCTFNCLRTGSTFMTNSIKEAIVKLEIIRKDY